jgi:hypothetical protein
VLFLLGQEVLHQTAGRRVVVAEPADDLGVPHDHDALGDQVFCDHLDQRVAGNVLGGAAGKQTFRVEVRRAAELSYTQGDLISVELLVVGVLEELLGDGLGMDALGHEVMTLVAQHAYQLGCQYLVEDTDCLLQVATVG